MVKDIQKIQVHFVTWYKDTHPKEKMMSCRQICDKHLLDYDKIFIQLVKPFISLSTGCKKMTQRFKDWTRELGTFEFRVEDPQIFWSLIVRTS